MLSGLKSIFFSAFGKVFKRLHGTGIGRIPLVWKVYDFLFQLFWSNKDIVEVQGSKMYVNIHDKSPSMRKTFQHYALSRVHEGSTTEMFKEVVKEGDVVVDLGANMGYFTLLAARLIGRKGKVYAFEPEPINYGVLTKNIELNGYNWVIPIQKAVSNKAGIARLYISPEDTGHNTLTQYDGRYDNGREFVEVETVALDEFFKDKEHQIDVIKMDIEGAEMLALSGMDRAIRENKNLRMFVEFFPTAIREMGYSPEEFARRLTEDYKFSMFAVGGDYSTGKENVKIDSVEQLMNLCKGQHGVANLFLERK